jgi:hypothetical protein
MIFLSSSQKNFVFGYVHGIIIEVVQSHDFFFAQNRIICAFHKIFRAHCNRSSSLAVNSFKQQSIILKSIIMVELVPIFAIVGTFSSIIVFLYLHYNSRHKIRLALIQNNKEATIFNQGGRSGNALGALKYGMVAIGLGLGIFLAALLERGNIMDGEPAYFGMMLLMGGFGLLLYYFIAKNKKEESDIIL